MREITSAEIEAVKKPWVWDIATQVLYDLCRTYPLHTSIDEIIAKVLLIGRSHAAAIERRKNVTRTGDFYILKVGPVMKNNNIDVWFTDLTADPVPGCPASIVVHRRLQNLFFEITDLAKRSLASKYLHFHFPEIFFIYDSRAAGAIRSIVPRLSEIPEIRAKPFDRVYRDFVRKCLWLRRHIYELHSIWLSPRQIDRILLAIADESFSGAKPAPALGEFKESLKVARRQARKAGMKKSDIAAAIHNVRRRS